MGEGTATKPQLGRRRIIERPRLIRLLDESPERIKMLVAPAGYGKTTLARQWLRNQQSSWYVATRASRDVAALAGGLQAAVNTVCSGAGEVLLQRLRVTPNAQDDAGVLASMLAEDLQAWPASAWLALDDYQAVAGARSAERFLETLLVESPLNVVLLTRQRPSWASSRRILYGDVFEMSRQQLAMCTAEAQELLRDSKGDIAEIIDLSRGWTAVLALAAASGAALPDLVAAPHLFGFFAEEIYGRIDRRLRRSLATLALFDGDGRRLVLQAMRSEDRERLIQIGIDTGFLTETESTSIDMHPLLKTFLEHKLVADHPDAADQVIVDAVDHLIRNQLWDEAFELIQRFGQTSELPALIEASREALLATGRTSTLSAWIADAPDDSPSVRLAHAELALRSGQYYRAEALARLASQASTSRAVSTQACLIAGRAAHVASREEEAYRYYAEAVAAAPSPELAQRAEFGMLQAALELEHDDVPQRLEVLSAKAIFDPETQVILADRKLGVETRYGFPVDVSTGRAARQLLPLVRDPMVRTSFRNVLGYTLAAMCLFDEALDLTAEQISDAERCRLDFVMPYALIVQALVQTGQRQYLEAEESLDEAGERATATGDQTVANIAAPVRMRLHISQGAFDLAMQREVPPQPTTRSLAAEFEACRALALAGVGQLDRAADLANRALERSRSAEAQLCANAALAVVRIRQHHQSAAEQHALAALEQALHTQMVECLVCALRGFPDFGVCLLQSTDTHEGLRQVLEVAGGYSSTSTAAERLSGSVLDLSRREREVLALVAQGMSNPAIGRALFISPTTVKVHVRHIFEKLGVKSRAEAAMRAGQLGQ